VDSILGTETRSAKDGMPGNPLVMLWTAPATGISMYQSTVALEQQRESAYG
jgi:hypothetical protein